VTNPSTNQLFKYKLKGFKQVFRIDHRIIGIYPIFPAGAVDFLIEGDQTFKALFGKRMEQIQIPLIAYSMNHAGT